MDFIRWFRKQKDCLSFADTHEGGMVIARDKGDNGSKEYGWCSSRKQFMDGYILIMFSSAAIYYNMFRLRNELYENYDYDFEGENPPSAKDVWNQFERFYDHFQSVFHDTQRPSWVVSDSNAKNKTSIHIKNERRRFQDVTVMRTWYEEYILPFLEKHKDKYPLLYKHIDPSITSRNRCMRMIGSSKAGKNRYLRPATFHIPSMIMAERGEWGRFDPTYCPSFMKPELFSFESIDRIIKDKHIIPSQPLKVQFKEEGKENKTEKMVEMVNELIENKQLRCLDPETNKLTYTSWLNMMYDIAGSFKQGQMEFESMEKISETLIGWYRHASSIDNIIVQLRRVWDSGSYSSGLFLRSVKEHPQFKSLFEVEADTKNVPFYPLGPITAQETLQSSDIGDYFPRNQKADVVCVRSPMGTRKTEQLKNLLLAHPEYKRVALVTFRRSLDADIFNKMKDLGFVLYSHLSPKQYETEKRIVCQVDSLHKLRGKVDLFILDEMRYTIDHLISFSKNKSQNWNALCQYIKESPKVIIADALLTQEDVEFIHEFDRTTHTVVNTFLPYDGHKTILYPSKEKLVMYIIQQLQDGKKVVVPTTSKIFADSLMEKLRLEFPSKRLGKITKDTPCIPVGEWNQYDCLVYTPTISAGVSFSERHFDVRCCYFTNRSCNAEIAAQMIFRVRQTSSKEIHIYVHQCHWDTRKPVTNEAIDKWIRDQDSLTSQYPNLHLHRPSNTIQHDTFYRQFRRHIRTKNVSQMFFVGKLNGVLLSHGIVMERLPTEDDEVTQKKMMRELKQCSKTVHERHYKRIVEAPLLTDQQYQDLDERDSSEKDDTKTREDRDAMCQKYRLMKTYFPDIRVPTQRAAELAGIEYEPPDKRITMEFVRKNIDKQVQFRNLTAMNMDTGIVEQALEYRIRQGENHRKRNSETTLERLEFRNRQMQLYELHKLIKECGFESVFDRRRIKVDIENVKRYRKEKDNHLGKLFDVKETNDKSKDGDILMNSQTMSMLGIKIMRVNNPKKKMEERNYYIKGLDHWEKQNIEIPRTDPPSYEADICVCPEGDGNEQSE